MQSTNDLAARAGSALANDGLVVLAEEQSAGRGQRGRSWTAPSGSSILMSILVFPPAALTSAQLDPHAGSAWLTAMAALVTAEIVTEWTSREARIKWPNDVRVEGRKIAGILVERVLRPLRGTGSGRQHDAGTQAVVIGVGLNVNIALDAFPPELQSSATSVAVLNGGQPVDRSALARALVQRFDACYERIVESGPGVLSDASHPQRAPGSHGAHRDARRNAAWPAGGS